MLPLEREMWGWRCLSPCIELSHLTSEDFFATTGLCKTLVLPMMVPAFRFEEVPQENSFDSSAWKQKVISTLVGFT